MTGAWESGFVYRGMKGLAFSVNSYRNVPAESAAAQETTLAHWFVNAPWAHPAWSQYMLYVVHLRPVPTMKPPVIHRSNVTHEFMMFALDPRSPPFGEANFVSSGVLDCAIPVPASLFPANEGYQFTCESDEAAIARIRPLVERIADGDLNPDTDNRAEWRALFADGVPLITSIFEEINRPRGHA